ncbi:hypothetical protein [Ornithinimicrobium cerasi]|uniref:Glycosyltransferase subfamily 4-like N-terminal domain-containing protein n=1 Tax=Ornithinimicrobium cerasi TaxID=2248773 RepID=A0A285VWE1_9MICO|nr:hypothetical protein [Ornithinimicrobium cerasi]SOC58332.1 hypothetical protein SAMN05421879_12910 [Ornithinimicrobium cerasi]
MQQDRHVVFCLNEIGVLGGVTSAVESLAGLLEEHGWKVSFLGITSRRRGPDRDRRDWRPLIASPRLTTRIRGAGLANRVLRRADFALARRRLTHMPAGSVVVFTNVWVKKELDAAGYRGKDFGHYLVGQHHGSLAGSQASWEFDAMLDHYRDLDVFVALCEADAGDFAEHLDVPCTTLSNLVGLPALGRVPVQGRVLSVGRLDPNKDVERVVRLFERARREVGADWHLHVFGDGPSRSSVEEMSAAWAPRAASPCTA